MRRLDGLSDVRAVGGDEREALASVVCKKDNYDILKRRKATGREGSTLEVIAGHALDFGVGVSEVDAEGRREEGVEAHAGERLLGEDGGLVVVEDHKAHRLRKSNKKRKKEKERIKNKRE